MNNLGVILLSTLAGLGLGLFFYGGLYVTVVRGLKAKYAALWFVASFFLRLSIVMVGFYKISNGQWERLVPCLFAFMLIGMIYRYWNKRTIVNNKEMLLPVTQLKP